MEEEEKARREEFEKKHRDKEIADRMRNYGELVKQNHAPRVKTKEEEEE